jgi:hypothetical protein
LSGCVAAVPPAAACAAQLGRSAHRARRRPGWKNRSSISLNGGVSVIVALDDLTANRSRREMAPQGLENVHSAPGNGMAPEILTYKIWYAGVSGDAGTLTPPPLGARLTRVGSPPEGQFLVFAQSVVKPLKRLKTAMGGPCKELAPIVHRRHVCLASAPRPLGIERRAADASPGPRRVAGKWRRKTLKTHDWRRKMAHGRPTRFTPASAGPPARP